MHKLLIQKSLDFFAWLNQPSAALVHFKERQKAQLTMRIALLLGILFGVSAGVGATDTYKSLTAVLFPIAMLIVYGLARTRYYEWAAFLLTTVVAALGFLFAYSSANPAVSLLSFLSLAFVLGSALLNVWLQLAFCLFSSLLAALSPIFLPSLTPKLAQQTSGDLLTLGLLIALITQFRSRLEQKLLSEAEATNANLQKLLVTMEDHITERSQAAEAARAQAESARIEAEAARKDFEIQVWLATGQTQLLDALRGEQTITQLTNNVLTQLCRYSGAQAGALFLLDEKTLTLSGTYAYTPRPDFSSTFDLGEGFIGQAALDKKIIVETIPSESMIISTGLVKIPARQIAIIPFYMNEKVIGVIELATLGEFTASHLELWRRVSETLGTAFNTVQTRQHLAALMASHQADSD